MIPIIHSCIPVGWQFIAGSIIPFCLIYVYNCIMFVIITTSIARQQNKMKTSTGNKSLQTNFKQQTMLLLTLSLIFGLGWSLGLAATNSLPITWLRSTFEFLFIALTGFQGLFILLLYGVRLRNVRIVWLKWVYTIGGQRSKAASLELGTQSTSGGRQKRPTYQLGSYQTSSGNFNSDNQVKPISMKLLNMQTSPTTSTCTSPDSKIFTRQPSPEHKSESPVEITELTIKEKLDADSEQLINMYSTQMEKTNGHSQPQCDEVKETQQ